MGNAHLAWRQQPWKCHFSRCLCIFCEATASVASLQTALVSKPVYHKVQTVMGVSGQLESTYFRRRQCGYCGEQKSFPYHISWESVSFPWELRRSQISHSKFHFPVSQLSSFPSDTGNSAAAGKESLSKNSGCMIKDFSDPYGYLKLEQTEGKAGIKLWIWLVQHS